MALFKSKKEQKVVMAKAPEEEETKAELQKIEELSRTSPEQTMANYRQIPICMSQTQINNLTIENNIMLKEIISRIEEED